MATGKILTVTTVLGIAGVVALVSGLSSTARGQAAGKHSERNGQGGCSEATLQGDYLIAVRTDARSDSPDPTFPRVAAGIRTFDGAGKLSQVTTVNSGGQITHDVDVQGTYTLGSNCTGRMTIGGSRNWDIYVAANGTEGVAVAIGDGVTAAAVAIQTFKKP
jgi:hypothetical protein